jgi:hypothetical protein
MATLRLAIMAAVATGCGLAGAAAQADEPRRTGEIDSSAFAVAARFVSEATSTGLRPVPFAFGDGGRRYRRSANRDALSETLGIAAAGQQIATLKVTAGHLRAHAASTGIGIDFVEPSADGSIDSLQITLQPYPPPVGGPAPSALLSIVASGVAWKASDSVTLPKTPVVAGSASFTLLTITGTLLANGTVTGVGAVAPNDTVAFGDGSVRITLNQQVTDGLLSCTPTCAFIPFGITTDAVAIHLEQVSISGHAITGDIKVGEAEAHVRP